MKYILPLHIFLILNISDLHADIILDAKQFISKVYKENSRILVNTDKGRIPICVKLTDLGPNKLIEQLEEMVRIINQGKCASEGKNIILPMIEKFKALKTKAIGAIRGAKVMSWNDTSFQSWVDYSNISNISLDELQPIIEDFKNISKMPECSAKTKSGKSALIFTRILSNVFHASLFFSGKLSFLIGGVADLFGTSYMLKSTFFDYYKDFDTPDEVRKFLALNCALQEIDIGLNALGVYDYKTNQSKIELNRLKKIHKISSEKKYNIEKTANKISRQYFIKLIGPNSFEIKENIDKIHKSLKENNNDNYEQIGKRLEIIYSSVSFLVKSLKSSYFLKGFSKEVSLKIIQRLDAFINKYPDEQSFFSFYLPNKNERRKLFIEMDETITPIKENIDKIVELKIHGSNKQMSELFKLKEELQKIISIATSRINILENLEELRPGLSSYDNSRVDHLNLINLQTHFRDTLIGKNAWPFLTLMTKELKRTNNEITSFLSWIKRTGKKERTVDKKNAEICANILKYKKNNQKGDVIIKNTNDFFMINERYFSGRELSGKYLVLVNKQYRYYKKSLEIANKNQIKKTDYSTFALWTFARQHLKFIENRRKSDHIDSLENKICK